MISTTYQCDQCRDVLVHGLSLEERSFGAGAAFEQDAEIPAGGLHFCGLACLEFFLRRMEAD